MNEIYIDELADSLNLKDNLRFIKEAYEDESIICYLYVEKYGRKQALEYLEDIVPDLSVKQIWAAHDNIACYVEMYINNESDTSPELGSTSGYHSRTIDSVGSYNGPRIARIESSEESYEYESSYLREDNGPDLGYLEDMSNDGEW